MSDIAAKIKAVMDQAHQLSREATDDSVRLVQAGRCDGLAEALDLIEQRDPSPPRITDEMVRRAYFGYRDHEWTQGEGPLPQMRAALEAALDPSPRPQESK